MSNNSFHRMLISEFYPTPTVRKLQKFSLTVVNMYRNLFSHFFGKNFVKPTFLLKKLLKRWFDEIFFWWVNFSFYHTAMCLSNLCGKNFVKVNITKNWKNYLPFLLKTIVGRFHESLYARVWSSSSLTSITWMRIGWPMLLAIFRVAWPQNEWLSLELVFHV